MTKKFVRVTNRIDANIGEHRGGFRSPLPDDADLDRRASFRDNSPRPEKIPTKKALEMMHKN